MAKKKKTKTPMPTKLPGANAVHLNDRALVGHIFYRDASNPAGSVWYSAEDPNAKGDLVILHE